MITQVVLPLFPAVATGFAFMSSIIGVVVWVFTNFERKPDAEARYNSVNTRLNTAESLLSSVARDVSYIRGRMEPK